MSGNSFGTVFRVTTWGESHGPALGAVVDGCPPGVEISEFDIQQELDRRKPRSQGATPRRESDRVEILSGIFEGRTTGTPVSLLIRNADADSAAYEFMRTIFRPGHGDYTYWKKYGIRDHRGGGRASGRETAARVAAGAIARKIVGIEGIEVRAFTRELAGIRAERVSFEDAAENLLRCPDSLAAERMEQAIEQAQKQGDTVGGVVEVIVRGCPAGLGEPVFDKMDADLAKALMSIGSVKGVEIGAGFEASRMRGSECNDPVRPEGFLSNNAGGVLAGITTGQEIVIRAACKPVPSIFMEQETIDTSGMPAKITVRGRHDVCVIPRILPVCEAMVCIVLADHLLRHPKSALVNLKF
ncbi:MAG: chorismate synthase [Desulfobacteraceae bacterium]|nr:MAG: chorismate synthase [Desulfobacteraceae bacterium]